MIRLQKDRTREEDYYRLSIDQRLFE